MSRIELAAAELPLGQRLLTGLRYPLTGAGLAACIALGLCRYANLLARVAIDPGFLPDDQDHTAAPARLAARSGMPALASHLARGLLERWPRRAAATDVSGLVANADPIP